MTVRRTGTSWLLVALLALAAARPVLAQDAPAGRGPGGAQDLRTTGTAPADRAAFDAVFSPDTLGPARRGPSALLGWTQGYRGTMPNAAFAITTAPNGGSIWRFVSGRATPEQARDEALDGCRAALRRQPQLSGLECRVLAVNGAVEGHPTLAPVDVRVGPLRAAPFQFHRGPATAAGVLVYSHGYGGPVSDNRGNAAPTWLSAFNDLGWDILRFDRDPSGDDLFRAVAVLKAVVPELRAMGYRQVILAGQSRGGWQSLVAASEMPPGQVQAVIATAPAAHGTTGATRPGAAEDWERLLRELPARAPRVAVALFDEDPFDPGPEERAELLAARGIERGAPTLALRPSTGAIKGHLGGAGQDFARLYTGCLLALSLSPQPPEGIRRDPCPR